MTAQAKQTFEPSKELIRAAEALMVAMANEQLVRPVVETYEAAILAKHNFPPAPEYREDVREAVILDRKSTFLLASADFDVFLSECFAARDAANLKVSKPENCPLLEAEHLRIRAENLLIKQLGDIQGLEAFKSSNTVLTIEQRAAIVEIALRLVAPFIDDAQGVLMRYMNG